jgi:hypothetical protein
MRSNHHGTSKTLCQDKPFLIISWWPQVFCPSDRRLTNTTAPLPQVCVLHWISTLITFHVYYGLGCIWNREACQISMTFYFHGGVLGSWFLAWLLSEEPLGACGEWRQKPATVMDGSLCILWPSIWASCPDAKGWNVPWTILEVGKWGDDGPLLRKMLPAVTGASFSPWAREWEPGCPFKASWPGLARERWRWSSGVKDRHCRVPTVLWGHLGPACCCPLVVCWVSST